MIYVKPANGRKVRFPASDRPGRAGKHVPVTGAKVERTMYWVRRLMFGDVVEIPEPEPTPEPPKKTSKRKARRAE